MTSFLSSRRKPSLRRLIRQQCHCSGRCVYLLDEHFDFPTDQDIDEFISYARSTKFKGAHGIDYDCDDPAREFWCKSKKWFGDKGLNVASAFLLRRATSLQKAHAFNFFVRKSDCRLIFIDNYEQVPIAGRAYLVVM